LSIKVDLVTETTARSILEAERHRNALLEVLAADKVASITSDLSAIQRIVKNGLAPELFHIGDQIIVPWKDVAADKTYEVPLDIVHFGTVELKDGETVPAMFLQWHYATPFGMQFDNYEAFYYCEEALAAGTYCVTMGNSWGENVVGGKSYYFTLTKDVPTGGQLAGFRGMPDQATTNWKVYSYESREATEVLESVTVTEGTGGISLGTITNTTKYADSGVNNMHRVGYGYNRWAQSGIRQWLNSKAAAGAWWKPQNVFDRAPDQLTTKAGFLSGFEDDFLKILGEIKVVTNLNTVSDSEIGTQEVTYDKIFLPSLEQIYVNPQLAGEGEYWEYWKRATGATAPQAQHGTYPERITYALENQTAAQSVRLRSATRGHACTAWNVYTSGHVYNNYASYAFRCAPACVIC